MKLKNGISLKSLILLAKKIYNEFKQAKKHISHESCNYSYKIKDQTVAIVINASVFKDKLKHCNNNKLNNVEQFIHLLHEGVGINNLYATQ